MSHATVSVSAGVSPSRGQTSRAIRALERHLGQRWKDLFNARTDVVLYDLTSTYFEGTAEEAVACRRSHPWAVFFPRDSARIDEDREGLP